MERNQILPPLPEAKWADNLANNLTGNVLNVHRMIAHNPELMAAYAPFRNYMVKESCLTERQRELLILRTAHNLQSDYEWKHHVVRGRAAGLTNSEISRVQVGPQAPGWTEEEATLLRCADEMHHDQLLAVETAHQLQAHLGNEGIIAAIFTIGLYLTLGTILKSFAVPLDEAIQPLGS
ncbi:MAG: carboxymuconolactone decarboxylase family protein [Chloroflexota bacterium]